MKMKLMQDCAAKEGATDADQANTLAYQPTKTPTEKCLHACIGESLGLVKCN